MKKTRAFGWILGMVLVGLCTSCTVPNRYPANCVPCVPIYSQPETTRDLRIKFFITNDVHGHALAEKENSRIGYAMFKTYTNKARADGFETYLLDAGDVFSGSAYAQFDSGRSIARIIGRMGYSVITPGNHAFDYNMPENNQLHYARLIENVAANSDIPLSVVSLNLSFQGQDFPGVNREPVLLRNVGDGLRIVVAGVLTPYTAGIVSREGVDGFDFGLVTVDEQQDHAATKRSILTLVEDKLSSFNKPGDIVLILSHVGYEDSDAYGQGQISGRDLALVPHVDIVSDSHSHVCAQPEKIGAAWYVSGGRYLEDFVEITLTGSPDAPEISVVLRTYDDVANLEPDPEIARVIDGITRQVGMDRQLFHVDNAELFTDLRIAEESTPLGRFICSTMAECTGADLALYNSGGIRSGLGQGWVTIGAIHNMTPFLNNLVCYTMTGQDILSMFAALPAPGTNGFPQFYGMTVYAWKQDTGRLGIAGVLDTNGAPLDPSAVYNVAMNSFMAQGGDGFSFSHQGQSADHGDCATRMITHLQAQPNHDFEAISTNNTLHIFPSREQADAAWNTATHAVLAPAA